MLFVLSTTVLAYSISRKGITTWYSRINVPNWAPNTTTLTAIWIAAYVLYAIAMALYIQAGTGSIMHNDTYFWLGTASFVAVGLLGIIWNYIFFTFHRIMPAIYVSALIGLLILCSVVMFASVNLLSALFAAIYLAWIAYIARITYLIWELNT